jgi:TP901 family phage tail tape measure protein
VATRTVTVRLIADISQYTRNLRQASDNTSKLAGVGAKVGAAMLTGFAVAAAAAAKFDKALSNVRAVSGASSQQMAKLRAAALEAGKSTQYSATQAADAEAELARAGVSVADITGGALKGSLALAAAGQMDLADAATVSAQAMNTFGLKGKDVSHIADVLSAGANKSAADVHGLSMALRQGGLLANQTGLSLEETVGALSAFADHALVGSDAGTSLKTMLQRLTPQSEEARAMMARLGFTAYDSQGRFVGLAKMAGNLQKSFGNLTPEARNAAFATIFGSDAVRSATILYELGAGGVQKYTKAVNDNGAAARVAAIQTDNLAGDMERLRGAFETALIEGGSAANGALRTMVQWVTRLVDAYNDLPPALQKGVTLFTGVGGAALLAVSAFVLLLPRIAATRTALVALGVTGARVRTVLMGLGRLTNVVAGLTVLSIAAKSVSDQFKDAPPNVTKMANALVDLATKSQVAGELSKTFGKDLDGLGEAAARIAHPGTLDRIEDFFGTFDPGTDVGGPGLDKATEKLKALDEALAELAQSGNSELAAKGFDRLAAAAEKDGTSKEKLLTLLPQYSDALASVDTQNKTASSAQAELAKQMGMTADSIRDQRTEAEKLADVLQGLNGTSIDAAEQEIQFRQSLADLTDAVKENGHSLDVTTAKGRKVKGAFLDVAKAAMEHAKSVAEQTNSQAKGQAALDKDVTALKRQMRAAHFSEDAIANLTAAYLKLPSSVATEVDAKTQGAINDLQTVQNKIKTTKGKTVTVDALTKEGQKNLEDLGFKIKRTKGKKVEITAPTGGPQSAVNALARAIAGLHGKNVNITYTTTYRIKGTPGGPPAGTYHGSTAGRSADGNLYGPVRRYAAGGMENHVAQIAQPTYRMWAEPETGGEAYIPLAPSKRGRSRMIAAETVKRLGGAVQWFASGGIPGFTYTPTGRPVLGGPSDAKQRYDQEIEDLKRAWDELTKALKAQKQAADKLKDAEKNLSRVRHGHHTKAQLRAAEERVDKARKAKRETDATVRKDRGKVNAADEELGLKHGAKVPKHFNLKAYETQLNESLAATEKWRKNLDKVGRRGGSELQKMLEGMGEGGQDLVNALAGASDKEFKRITEKLKKTGDLAKATLGDFTKQLDGSTKKNQQFAADLQKLAAQGFGDLAQALAAQGDESAMELAHQAAGDKGAATKANASVDKAQATLTGEDLANSLVLLSTLRGGTGRGYADLIAAGLDVGTIRALVPKMTKQISSLPAANKDEFVKEWVQQGGKPMAIGGILTRPTMVLGGEAGVPESWIPWTGTARSRTLLAKTAAAMGYRLTPAGRYASAGVSAAAVAREVTRITNITLNGAKQTSAEQAADIVRHMTFVG